MSRRQPYTAEFYEKCRQGSFRSAEVIISALLRLISFTSVVDIGCGVGTWLRAVGMHGVSDFLGIDGEYIDRAELQVPDDRFMARDLTSPLKLNRIFDLAISLEVAEHLPPECASSFIHSLAALAPIILFSAAIPFQGGNQHVNEQWPDYWASLFKQHGYVPVDCIRPTVWDDPRVDWWYAQNTFIYSNQEGLARNTALAKVQHGLPVALLSVVHPRNYLRFADPLSPGGFRRSLSQTALVAKNVFGTRFHDFPGRKAKR
jgi:SAM-dependent methyltransferase